MTEDEVRFPDRDYPSDFELRLEPDPGCPAAVDVFLGGLGADS
jgi:hypothetical protein